jgi:hypothetical protein
MVVPFQTWLYGPVNSNVSTSGPTPMQNDEPTHDTAPRNRARQIRTCDHRSVGQPASCRPHSLNQTFLGSQRLTLAPL